MGRTLKRSFILVLALMFLTSSLTINSFARTWGNEDTQEIYVSTKANWWKPGSESITLKQDKATITFKHLWKNQTKTKKAYGYYNVTVKSLNGGKSFTKEWDGTSSLKINLQRNQTYRITVQFDRNETYLSNDIGKAPWCYSFANDSGYSWWVNSTYKATAR